MIPISQIGGGMVRGHGDSERENSCPQVTQPELGLNSGLAGPEHTPPLNPPLHPPSCSVKTLGCRS